ncbi:hypothetical protein Tco_1068611 [Tanacetum coccineum]|uniref:Uncharacterized protein n=1 Tax=Tanacetum coccineum TaxID=301880 RepID=A0ABQ5HHM2_9ASTR
MFSSLTASNCASRIYDCRFEFIVMIKARTRSGFKHRLQHFPSQCDKNIIIIVTEQFDPSALPHVQLLLIKYVLKNLMIRKHGNGYIKNEQKMKLSWTNLSTGLEERGKIEAKGIFTNGPTRTRFMGWCMRTRSSSNLIVESSTIPKRRNRRRSKQIVKRAFGLCRNPPVATIAGYVRYYVGIAPRPIEGYGDPAILFRYTCRKF